MRRDMTREETLAAAEYLLDTNDPGSANTVKVALESLLNQPSSILEHSLAQEHLRSAEHEVICTLRKFLDRDGEIHLVENGKNPGKVIAVRRDG